NSDMFTITDLGKEFAFTEDDSNEEQELLINSLLKYPPATQVLRILSENDGYKTKFFIGNQLGFRGEKGFTSYDETLMIDWIKSAPEHEITSIRNDVEGTSDKYARMISTWLKKLGLIYSHSEKIEKNSGKFNNFMAYEITAKGKHSLRQANGFSSNSRVRKHVMWEFLATNGSNRNYVRTRRAHILKSLQETSSFNVLLDKLKQSGFDDDKYINNFIAYEITAKGKHSLRQANGFSSNSRVRKHVMWEFLATNGSNRNYVRTRRAHILKSLQETSSFNVLLDKLKQSGFDDDKY